MTSYSFLIVGITPNLRFMKKNFFGKNYSTFTNSPWGTLLQANSSAYINNEIKPQKFGKNYFFVVLFLSPITSSYHYENRGCWYLGWFYFTKNWMRWNQFRIDLNICFALMVLIKTISAYLLIFYSNKIKLCFLNYFQ